MRAVVVGGTGLIGSRVVAELLRLGHDPFPASPETGVNTVSGEGIAQALEGASVVIDVSNSPSLEGAAALAFFTASTRNLLAAEAAEGVRHHVALSVVGTDRLSAGGYFEAKLAQERLIADGPIPYSIVHATQFFEFIRGIADAATEDGTARVAPVLIQPMAADEVASAVARVAVGAPLGTILEIGGPEELPLDQLVRRYLEARGDARRVVADPGAGYFGVPVGERTLLPDADAEIGSIGFELWLRTSAARTKADRAERSGRDAERPAVPSAPPP